VAELHRYWFQFDLKLGDDAPAGTLLGCGVTAFNYEDAIALLGERVFRSASLPPIVEVREDVDVSQLDPGHVLPNMGIPIDRGVWFPKGYEPFDGGC
jgi:hypothetical protein